MAERNAYYDEDGERDYASEMIDWLADKPQDVWADVAPSLNWDCAEHVLKWMVEQERCDLAIATWIFWATDITSVVKDGRYPEWRSGDAGKIAVTVINNLRRGFYRSSKLRFAQPYRDDLLHAVERWRTVPDAFKRKHSDLDLPTPLLGPFKGRRPLPLPHWRAQHNPYVWDLFKGMATNIGQRPGWNNLFNIYLLSDWRLVLGASAVLTALLIAFDQLMRL
jgi:hypothetical protein